MQLDKLQGKLALYFFAMSKGQPVFGPFVELPAAVQCRVLHVLYYMQALSPALLKAIARACHLSTLPEETVRTALDVVSMRCADLLLHQQAGTTAEAVELLQSTAGFCLAVALGAAWEDVQGDAQSEETTDAGLAAAAGQASSAQLFPSLLPVVSDAWQYRAGPKRAAEQVKVSWEDRAAVVAAAQQQQLRAEAAALAWRRATVSVESFDALQAVEAQLIKALKTPLPLQCAAGLLTFSGGLQAQGAAQSAAKKHGRLAEATANTAAR